MIEQQLTAWQELADKGYFSKIRLLEYKQLKIEHIQNIAVQEANVSKARAAMANIMNKDIGYIRDGQLVRVKLKAFNFTDYGIVPGVVESISSDAIDMSQPGQQAQRDEQGRAQPQQGLVYTARIRLKQRTIHVRGCDQIIGPGLAAQVEIKTGEGRIIDFLLSPIAQTMDEARARAVTDRFATYTNLLYTIYFA